MSWTGVVIRRLARSEEMFAQSRTFVGVTARLTGVLDADAMAVAFDALLRTHPVLAAHLERGPDDLHQLVADDFEHPGIWVAEQGLGEGAAPRLDQAVALANLGLVLDEGHATATLYTHHSLADAQHQFGLLAELFSFYTDVVATGSTGPVNVEPAPEPLEVLLEQRGIAKQQRSGLERLLRAMYAYELPPSPRRNAGGDPAAPTRVPVARCRLTEGETLELATFCRDQRVSIHAVVSAAILLAEWQIRNTPEIPIPYLYPVDLRLLLSPPVEATGSTNPLGLGAFLAEIGAGTELVDLARDIVGTFREDLADRVTQQSLLHVTLQYEGSPPGLPDPVMATDGGTVPTLRTPPDVTVASLQSELFTASAAGVDLYTFSVYSGRLQIEHHAHAPAPDGTMAAIHSLLCSVASDDDDWLSE